VYIIYTGEDGLQKTDKMIAKVQMTLRPEVHN